MIQKDRVCLLETTPPPSLCPSLHRMGFGNDWSEALPHISLFSETKILQRAPYRLWDRRSLVSGTELVAAWSRQGVLSVAGRPEMSSWVSCVPLPPHGDHSLALQHAVQEQCWEEQTASPQVFPSLPPFPEGQGITTKVQGFRQRAALGKANRFLGGQGDLWEANGDIGDL